MKQGDKVVPIADITAQPAKVLEIEDFGKGKGNERIKILLFGMMRFYAKKELMVTNEG